MGRQRLLGCRNRIIEEKRGCRASEGLGVKPTVAGHQRGSNIADKGKKDKEKKRKEKI